MQDVIIKAKLREKSTKSAIKQIRLNGEIPAVIYGGKKANVLIALNYNELNKAYHANKGKNTVLKLVYEKEGKELSETVISKVVSYDPLTHRIRHVDFVRLDEKHVITVKVPISIIGVSPGVKSGGVLIQNINFLTVSALPNRIPDIIEIDISKLEIGDHVKVAEHANNSQFKVLNEHEDIILQIQTPRRVEIEEAVAETPAVPTTSTSEENKASETKDE